MSVVGSSDTLYSNSSRFKDKSTDYSHKINTFMNSCLTIVLLEVSAVKLQYCFAFFFILKNDSKTFHKGYWNPVKVIVCDACVCVKYPSWILKKSRIVIQKILD